MTYQDDSTDDGGIRAWAEQGAAEKALFDSLPPAEPDTTAIAIRGGIGEITKALDAFDKIASELPALAEQYPADLVYDLTTKKGMAEAIEHRAAYRDRRTLLEKLRKAGKAPVLSLGKNIDARAAKLTADLEAGEKPVHQQIKAYEDAKAAEKQAKIDAEAGRVLAIQEALHELHMEGEVKAGTPSARIAERLATMQALVLDQATYQEQMREAEAARALVVAKLTTALDARRYAEAEAARLEADRAELAELRRLAAEQKRKDDEAAAAAQAAVQAAQRAQTAALAEAQAKLDAERAELQAKLDKLAADEKAKAYAEEARRLEAEAAAAMEQIEAVFAEDAEALAAQPQIAEATQVPVASDVLTRTLSALPELGVMYSTGPAGSGMFLFEPAPGPPDAIGVTFDATFDEVAQPIEEPTLKLGDLNASLGTGITMSEAFVCQTLGIPKADSPGRAVLFRPSQRNQILEALAEHAMKMRG